MFLSILLEVFRRSVILLLLLIVFIIFIIVQDTLHAGGRLAAIENHTLGFLILFKVLVAVLLFVLLTVKVLIHMCEHTFSLYYRILIQGDKTHPLIFIVCTINFIEYLQRYQIPIFTYYKLNFIIFFIIIQYAVYVASTLAAI